MMVPYFSVLKCKHDTQDCRDCARFEWFNKKVYYKNISYVENDDFYLFIVGDLYGHKNLKDIFRVYSSHRDVLNLDGIFTLIFISKKRPLIKIISDLSGFYPVYFANHEGELFLSTDQYELARITNSPPNLQELDVWAAAGRTTMGNTVYNLVKSTFPESVFELNFDEESSNNIKIESYQDSSDFLDDGRSLEEIAHTLITIVRNGCLHLNDKGYKFICDLSGGSDSRVTSFLAYKFLNDIKLYVSNKNKDDYEISHKFARECLQGVDYLPPFELPVNYRNRIGKNITEKLGKLTAGYAYLDFSLQTYMNNIYKKQHADVLVSGWPGEIFKGFWLTTFGIGINPYLKQGLREGKLEFLLKTRFIHGKPLSTQKAVLDRLKSEISNHINLNLRRDKVIDQIYLKYYGRIGITNLVIANFSGFKVWFPFATNQAIKLSRKVHPKFRILEDIHSYVLYFMDKNCSKIETAKTIFGKFRPFKLEPKRGIKRSYYFGLECIYNLDRAVKKFRELGRLRENSRRDEAQKVCNVLGLSAINQTLCETLKIWFGYLQI